VRILLDECLPRRLKRDLVGHEARTVPEMKRSDLTPLIPDLLAMLSDVKPGRVVKIGG
jgi:hypothetical protein